MISVVEVCLGDCLTVHQLSLLSDNHGGCREAGLKQRSACISSRHYTEQYSWKKTHKQISAAALRA